MADTRLVPFEVHSTSGTLTSAAQISTENELLAGDVENSLVGLNNRIDAVARVERITRGSFDTFNDSFVINAQNAAVNGGRVNIYAAKIDKIVNVTLPTTQNLADAGISYPYGVEFVHSAGTARLTTNNILRIDAGGSGQGDLINQPILQNPSVPSSRVQMFQDDIGLFIKDSAVENFRYLQGAFDPIAEITRQGVFAFRNDVVIQNIANIETELADIVINQGDAILVQTGGTRFGYTIADGDVILAKVNSPSLLDTSDDWLHFTDSSQSLSTDQMAFFGNVNRNGTRFDFTRNVFVDESNVIAFNSIASGTPLQLNYLDSNGDGTQRTRVYNDQSIQFADLQGGTLSLSIQFSVTSSSGFLPELTDLTFDFDGTTFVFPLTGFDPQAGVGTINIDIPNNDYSSILNTNCDITLRYVYRGATVIGQFNIMGLVNTLDGTLRQAVTDIAVGQDLILEGRIDTKINNLAGEIDTDEGALRALEPRISPYRNVQTENPDINALFLDTTASAPFPSDLNSFNAVSAQNPRFEGGTTAVFVAVIGGANYTLKNITQSTEIALDNSQPNVELGESLSFNNQVYFVYKVTSLTANDVYEVERVEQEQVVAWQDNFNNIFNSIDRIDAELEHAALNLPDEVVQVLENQVTVTEEDTPSIIASDYNKSFTSANTQTIFYEGTPVPPSGGTKRSEAISANNGNSKYRNKLLYIPSNTTYTNQNYVTAFDGASTSTDLISYINGTFFAKVFVPAIPASTRTETIYPSPSNKVAGAGIWQNIPALTFQNGVPVPLADELFFTRNLPTSSTTLTIQYRGHANGSIFGTNTTSLAGVGGSTEVATSFVLNDGSEQATVEVRWYPTTRDIRVTVTERVNTGLPTINDVEVILAFDESRTVPATPATTRDVAIETVTTTDNVFAFKPSDNGNLIIVGDNTEIDTNYAYTTLFGASENGWLNTPVDTATFLDFESIDPISATVRDLENHASLPQFGLFTTEYTHNTIVNLDSQLTVKDDNNTIRNVGNVLTDLLNRVVALEND